MRPHILCWARQINRGVGLDGHLLVHAKNVGDSMVGARQKSSLLKEFAQRIAPCVSKDNRTHVVTLWQWQLLLRPHKLHAHAAPSLSYGFCQPIYWL